MAFCATVRHAPTAGAPQSLRLFQKLRELRNIYCDSPRLVTSDQFGGQSPPRLILEIDVCKLLPAMTCLSDALEYRFVRVAWAETHFRQLNTSGKPLIISPRVLLSVCGSSACHSSTRDILRHQRNDPHCVRCSQRAMNS